MRTAFGAVVLALVVGGCDGGTPVRLEHQLPGDPPKVVSRHVDFEHCEKAKVWFSARCCGAPIGATEGWCDGVLKGQAPLKIICDAVPNTDGSVRCTR